MPNGAYGPNGSAGGASGRVVVISGASGGIGRATARLFGARGDRVGLLARGSVGLRAAERDVEAAGGRPLPIAVDVADPVGMEEAAERIERELGPIDVWINVAMSSVFARFMDITPEEFRRVTEVTYLGFVNGTRAALRRMLPRDAGTIVHTGSALGRRGIPLQSAYCAAKHAIQGFHESLRTELLHDGSGARVTIVQMPAVNTPQFDWVESRLPNHAQPMPPIYQPEVAARALAYAADHPERREYWVGGSTAATIAGNRVIPGLLDRYLARSAFDAQQTDRPEDPDRPANLWTPADGEDGRDYGAHGGFDDRSHSRSLQAWIARHRGLSAAATAGAAALAALAGRRAAR